MAISIQKTSIEGLTLIHPHVFEDQRGYFIKDFEKSVYEQNDLPILFYECNESKRRSTATSKTAPLVTLISFP